MGQTQTERKQKAREPACERARSLSTREEECPCDVIKLVDDTILAVRPPPDMKCSHKIRYKDAFVCTSPVRKEFYKSSEV